MTQTPPTPTMPSLEDASHGMSIQRIAALETPQPLSTALTTTAAPQAEAGYTTTEFWVTAVTEVIALLASAGVIGSGLAEKLTGMAGMVVAGAFYAISRGLRKQGTPG